MLAHTHSHTGRQWENKRNKTLQAWWRWRALRPNGAKSDSPQFLGTPAGTHSFQVQARTWRVHLDGGARRGLKMSWWRRRADDSKQDNHGPSVTESSSQTNLSAISSPLLCFPESPTATTTIKAKTNKQKLLFELKGRRLTGRRRWRPTLREKYYFSHVVWAEQLWLSTVQTPLKESIFTSAAGERHFKTPSDRTGQKRSNIFSLSSLLLPHTLLFSLSSAHLR